MTEADGAERNAPFPDKWPRASQTDIVERYHGDVRKLVAERFAASGKAWDELVHDPAAELTREDFEKIEADLLATGYRFEVSAVVSLQEEPDKYKPLPTAQDSGEAHYDEQGRQIVGTGDNVFSTGDVTGTARFISTVERVMEMLVEGVPDGTIAVIDDSGGTLTAPILADFAGVICLGGTVRAHLGILTREHAVPCLMAAEIDGLSEGDEILVEYSKSAADAYADAEAAAAQRARILKVSEGS
jgi:hypothetical protein